MKKKRKKKKTVSKMKSLVSKEIEKISQHEDIALKVTAQFFQDEIMPVLNIGGKVVGTLPTESIHLELKKGIEDFNYLMDDDSIKHFEFQSTYKGLIDLKRFRTYEAQLSHQYGKPVTTYVLFSGTIRNPITEFTEGINTYRIQPIIMQDKNADEIIAKLQKKVDVGELITKEDLVSLVLSPLMGGKLSQKERMSAAYDITRKATRTDTEVVRKVEAVIYIMADKFLDAAEMEQLKEEIKMTRLGKMLYEEGEERGQSKVMILIQKMSNAGELELVPRLTTDPEFYQKMIQKYGVEE